MQWHGDRNIKLIATTTHTGPRQLNFEKTRQCFEDDELRRNFLQFLGNNDDNGDESDDEEDNDANVSNILDNDEVTDDYSSERLRRSKFEINLCLFPL